MKHSRINRRQRRRQRQGALLVEFAVCLPILLLFLFGLWEYSRMEVVRETVKAAAFEGARQGIVEGATVAEMEQSADSWLRAFAIRGGQVDGTLTSESATMVITVPLLQNSFSATIFSRDAEITSRIELKRESFNG